MFLAQVYITLKPTVNDPQGLTVLGGVKNLGFDAVEDIRVGKFLEVRVAESSRQRAEQLVEELCQKLLANPVIEEYRYDLKELPPSPQAESQ